MTYRLIACDLDETLLNHNHRVPEKNLAAIKRAREEYGIQFVPATGRGYPSVQETLKELDVFDLENEYVISFNGGALTENKGNRLVEFKGLAFETMRELFEFGITKDVCIHVYTETELYLFNMSPSEQERMDNDTIDYKEPEENSVDFLRDEKIAKILYQNMEPAYLHSLEPLIEPIVRGKSEVSYSSNRYMEFNGLGINKGATLASLAEKLEIPLAETIAIGDNNNDIAMLQVAGLGVVAQNGVDSAKAVADYVTKADNEAGVVAEVLERYIFK